MSDDKRFLVGIERLTPEEDAKLKAAGLNINLEHKSTAMHAGWTDDSHYRAVSERSWLAVMALDESAAVNRVAAALERADMAPGDLIALAAQENR